MNVEVIRVDGTREQHVINLHGGRNRLRAVHRLIGIECADAVNLKDGRVMIVDDTGMIDGKPVNPEATKIYHAICRPGTVHQIHGDVALAVDADFE